MRIKNKTNKSWWLIAVFGWLATICFATVTKEERDVSPLGWGWRWGWAEDPETAVFLDREDFELLFPRFGLKTLFRWLIRKLHFSSQNLTGWCRNNNYYITLSSFAWQFYPSNHLAGGQSSRWHAFLPFYGKMKQRLFWILKQYIYVLK